MKDQTEQRETDGKESLNNKISRIIQKAAPKHMCWGQLIIAIFCLTIFSAAVMYAIKISGRYPQGTDTFCHLYRADFILKSISKGNPYPLYDASWYNGVELMRYWGPFPLYMIALLEGLAGGSILNAYVAFVGVLIFLGGIGWILWGLRYKRMSLAIVIGVIWFFMPENIRVFLFEGNLPRGVINALLPFFLYFLWQIIHEKRRKCVWGLLVITAIMTLCHMGITLMILISTFLFVVIYGMSNHSRKWPLAGFMTCVAGILITGIWAVPALIGGAAGSASTNQVMKNFFESATVSLNPMLRIDGDGLSFYFGLSIFIICVLGLIFGNKKIRAGFVTALLLYFMTTKSVLALFEKLPFSQFLWMIRFIPIALTMAIASFFLWHQLKRWMVVILSMLLIADCAVSFQYVYNPQDSRIENVWGELRQRADSMMLNEAKAVTSQRLALMDLSKYGSFAPYYIAGVPKKVLYTFGAGWEGAATASNIVRLNASLESGWYSYLFDRSLELGNDTVLIPVDNLRRKTEDVDKVIKSARLSGYDLLKQNGNSLLFHRDTDGQFGTVTDYPYLAIGKSAYGIAMVFPQFEEGTDDNINHYSYDELKKYKIIYLSGFSYTNKEKAEQLIEQLSLNGVKIFVDMNSIPTDRATKRMEFLGVHAQTITFTDVYPDFRYSGDTFKAMNFNVGDRVWNTVYLDGLDEVDGVCLTDAKNVPFVGSARNKNLHFIGLNIPYYLQTSNDSQMLALLQRVFDLDSQDLPDRKLVPVNITTQSDRIIITSSFDNVNTALSDIDIFTGNREYKVKNHLIIVNGGITILRIGYPHMILGIVVTGIGVAILIAVYIGTRKKHNGR